MPKGRVQGVSIKFGEPCRLNNPVSWDILWREVADIAINDQPSRRIASVMDKQPRIHPQMEKVPVRELDAECSFFASLREDYPGFRDWWDKISRQGREAFVVRMDNELQAILILKIEEGPDESVPRLPSGKKLKICTLYVQERGMKIGERLLRTAFEYAIANSINDIYLTHFSKPNDSLVHLIEGYGFEKKEYTDEDLFLKKLRPPPTVSLSPLDLCRKYYPSFSGMPTVKKFIIPIKPIYHKRLFEDCFMEKRTPLFPQFKGSFLSEGLAIKKAYLSHSQTRSISPGDLVLFYRSEDSQALTTLGIVESLGERMAESTEIIQMVGERSVYSREEIEVFSRKPTLVILFQFLFHLQPSMKYRELIQSGILKGHPQSIVQIQEDSFRKIVGNGRIDERFIVY